MSFKLESLPAFFRAHSTSNQTLNTGTNLTLGKAYNAILVNSNTRVSCEVSYVYGELKSTVYSSNLFDLDFHSRTTRQAQGWQASLGSTTGLNQDDGTYAVVSGNCGLFVENMITEGSSETNQCRIYGMRLEQ